MYVTPKVAADLAVATVGRINDGDEDVVKIDNVVIPLFYNTGGILKVVRGMSQPCFRLIRLNFI